MKLFIWEGVLCDYNGMIVAVANNVTEARRMVMEKYGRVPSEKINDIIESKIPFNQTPYIWREGVGQEPIVVDMKKPSCYVVYGGG